MSHFAKCAAVLVLLAMASSPAIGQTNYTVTPINESYSTYNKAINDAGQIVGWEYDLWSSAAFVWSNEMGIGYLPDLGGPSESANAINESGDIVGEASLPDGYTVHAVLWTAGAVQDLGTLGGRDSRAHGISETGQVVGEAQQADGTWRAFLWDADKGMQDLGTLGGAGSCAGRAPQLAAGAHRVKMRTW